MTPIVMKMAGCRLAVPRARGIRTSAERANPVRDGGTSRMILLPMAKSRKPWNMLSVPKVTISVGSLNRAMKKPLINPRPRPIIPPR